MAKLKLFILNDKNEKQLIAHVQTNPRTTSVDTLLVSSYTREPYILDMSKMADDSNTIELDSMNTNNRYKRVTLYAETVDEKKRLSGFAAFLKDRNKAGFCKFDKERHLYLLPPTHSKSSELIELINCVLLPATETEKMMKNNNKAIVQQANVQQKQISHNNNNAAVKQPPVSKSSDTTKVPAKSGGLLGSLVSKLNSTADARAQLAKTQAQPDKNTSALDLIVKMEEDLKVKIQAFENDSSVTELRLEAMEKDQRYVVHDVVTQYPNLLTASVGDMEDRHVVIYKKGHQPPDVEIHVSKSDLRAAPSGKAVSKKSIKGMPVNVGLDQLKGAVDKTQIHKLNTVKRDRRTIEEIERDMKRSKLEKGQKV